MALIEKWFEQDLLKTVEQRYIEGNFFSADNDGNLVGVKCYKDGAEASLSGTVTGYCVLSDGTTVPLTGTRSGNQAYIIMNQTALSVPGLIGVTIQLIDGTTKTTLLSIMANVYQSKTDAVVTPSQQIITDWANQINAALQAVTDASAAQDAKISDLKSAFDEFGAANIVPILSGTHRPGSLTIVGVDEKYSISGSPTGTGYTHFNIYTDSSAFPTGIKAGMKLQLTQKCSNNNIQFRFFEYVNGSYSELANIAGNGTAQIQISSIASGCIIRLSIANGYTYNNVVSQPYILGTLTKQQVESNFKALEVSTERFYPLSIENAYKLYIPNTFQNKAYSQGSIIDSSIRAIHIQPLNDGTVVLFNNSLYDGTYMVVDSETMSTLLVPNKGWNTSGKMAIDTQGVNDYTVILQFRDHNDDSASVNAENVSKNVTIFERNKIVDLFLFIGQSNMAGRGATSTVWPSSAPTLYPCAGLEYRAISSPTRLYPIAEPFGLNENKTGGINDGSSKTGSMVTAFVNTYFTKTGMQVVGVSASEGGTNIGQWASGSDRLNDAIQRLSNAVSFLTGKGYTIRHKYMLWCQGESDTRAGITPEQHKTYFDGIQSALLSAGIEKCFMVRIGEYNGTEYDYTPIINIQTQIAQTDPDVVMATTILASFKDRGMMKDEWHYYQAAYNEMGWYAGANVAFYVNNSKEPTMYDPKNDNLYYCHKN